MSSYICKPLGKEHQRTKFDCGNPILNDYLAKYATQDIKRKAAAVFVMVETAKPETIVGYYTLCATSVRLGVLPVEIIKKLPRYPDIPAILIGRLARDVQFPGLGSLLLADALTRCVRSSSEIAASLIVVDSKGPEATRFYQKQGFIPIPGRSDRMFLPVQTVERLSL